jgi:hypothetical protein
MGHYMMGPAPTPTPAEIDRLDRVQRAIADYGSVIDDVRKGVVSPDMVDTLREVYPAEYERIKGEAVDMIHAARAKGETLPYEQRRSLGILLDMPIDPLQDPKLVQAMHAAIASGPDKPAPAGERSRTGTPTQRQARIDRFGAGSRDTADEQEV